MQQAHSLLLAVKMLKGPRVHRRSRFSLGKSPLCNQFLISIQGGHSYACGGNRYLETIGGSVAAAEPFVQDFVGRCGALQLLGT